MAKELKTVSINRTTTNKYGTKVKLSDTYYVNEIPEYNFEKQRCENSIKLFNEKYIDEDTLAFAMEDLYNFRYTDGGSIEQPSFWTIANSLLWGYGGYKIKDGCFTDGTGYVSSYSTTISVNGMDKDVILIKKWGESLSDVYIYMEDLEQLVELLEKPTAKVERLRGDYSAIIKHIIRTELNYKESNLAKYMEGRYYPMSDKETKAFKFYKKCVNQVKTYDNSIKKYVLSKFEQHALEDIDDYTNYKEVFINPEGEGREAHFKAQIKETTLRLEKIRKYLSEIEK